MSRFKNGDTTMTMTRVAVLFLLIILVVMLFVYYGISNHLLSKGSSAPHLVMAENSSIEALPASIEKVKPEKAELDENSSTKDCHEKADKKVKPQEITKENDNQKKRKDKLSKDKDREFQRLSNIIKILKQADEVVDSLSY